MKLMSRIYCVSFLGPQLNQGSGTFPVRRDNYLTRTRVLIGINGNKKEIVGFVDSSMALYKIGMRLILAKTILYGS